MHEAGRQRSGTTAQSPRQVDNGIAAICALAWASGLIHVQAAIDHFDVSQLEVVLFVLLANAQFAWGLMVYRERSPALLWAGAGVSVLVAAAWVMSRTIGLPIGPHPWVPEPVGVIDVLATQDELVLALAVGVWMWRREERTLRVAVSCAAIALLMLSSLSLTGVSTHVH